MSDAPCAGVFPRLPDLLGREDNAPLKARERSCPCLGVVVARPCIGQMNRRPPSGTLSASNVPNVGLQTIFFSSPPAGQPPIRHIPPSVAPTTPGRSMCGSPRYTWGPSSFGCRPGRRRNSSSIGGRCVDRLTNCQTLTPMRFFPLSALHFFFTLQELTNRVA